MENIINKFYCYYIPARRSFENFGNWSTALQSHLSYFVKRKHSVFASSAAMTTYFIILIFFLQIFFCSLSKSLFLLARGDDEHR